MKPRSSCTIWATRVCDSPALVDSRLKRMSSPSLTLTFTGTGLTCACVGPVDPLCAPRQMKTAAQRIARVEDDLIDQLERNLHLSRLICRGRHHAEIVAVDHVARGSEHDRVENIERFNAERKGSFVTNRKSPKQRTIKILGPI